MRRKIPGYGLVLQARLGSTRLPRKALLPLGGTTLLDMVMERLGRVEAAPRILATDEASQAELRPLARRRGFELIVGSAEDVLSRYCDAIRAFGLERLVRATGDNPLVSHEAANALLEARGGEDWDYAAWTGMPLGMGVELVSSSALLRAEAEAGAPAEREHVCPYLYGNPALFRVLREEAPAHFRLPEGRVTVDLPEDYRRVLGLYGALYDGHPVPTSRVIAALASEGSAGGAP